MYFVKEGTQRCGLYRCEQCGIRFLDEAETPVLECPYCDEKTAEEGGGHPKTAILIQVLKDAQAVEEYDTLLSMSFSGGFGTWM